MAKKKTYSPIEKGLKGTDNCPVCGRAMEKRRIQILGPGGKFTGVTELRCHKHPGFDVSILVRWEHGIRDR